MYRSSNSNSSVNFSTSAPDFVSNRRSIHSGVTGNDIVPFQQYIVDEILAKKDFNTIRKYFEKKITTIEDKTAIWEKICEDVHARQNNNLEACETCLEGIITYCNSEEIKQTDNSQVITQSYLNGKTNDINKIWEELKLMLTYQNSTNAEWLCALKLAHLLMAICLKKEPGNTPEMKQILEAVYPSVIVKILDKEALFSDPVTSYRHQVWFYYQAGKKFLNHQKLEEAILYLSKGLSLIEECEEKNEKINFNNKNSQIFFQLVEKIIHLQIEKIETLTIIKNKKPLHEQILNDILQSNESDTDQLEYEKSIKRILRSTSQLAYRYYSLNGEKEVDSLYKKVDFLVDKLKISLRIAASEKDTSKFISIEKEINEYAIHAKYHGRNIASLVCEVLTLNTDNKLNIKKTEDEDIESEYKKINLGKKIPSIDIKPEWKKFKIELKEAREKFKKTCNETPNTLDAFIEGQRKFSISIKILLNNILSTVVAHLGEPPCEFCLIGLGSLARLEMGPYSDLDCALLINNETFSKHIYFKQLISLFNFYLSALGEPWIVKEWNPYESYSIEKLGFNIDNLDIEELFNSKNNMINTPKKLVLWLKHEIEAIVDLTKNTDATYGVGKYYKLLYPVEIYSWSSDPENSRSLLDDFQSETMKILTTHHQILGIKNLKHHMEEFECTYKQIKWKGVIDLKKFLTSHFTYLNLDLALFFLVKNPLNENKLLNNIDDILSVFHESKYFNRSFIETMQREWKKINHYRCEMQFERKRQPDEVQRENMSDIEKKGRLVTSFNKIPILKKKEEAQLIESVKTALIPLVSSLEDWIKETLLMKTNDSSHVIKSPPADPCFETFSSAILKYLANSNNDPDNNNDISTRDHKNSILDKWYIYTKVLIQNKSKLSDFISYYKRIPYALREECISTIEKHIDLTKNDDSQTYVNNIIHYLKLFPDTDGKRVSVDNQEKDWKDAINSLFVEKSNDNNSHEITIYTEDEKKIYFKNDIEKQLLDEKQKTFKRSSYSGGRHVVINVRDGKNIFDFKILPENPGISFVVHQLGNLLVGSGGPFTKTYHAELTGKHYAIEVIKHVAGDSIASLEYDLCLMSELPSADKELQATSIITPKGLFQLRRDVTEFKCILNPIELTELKFNSYLERFKKNTIKKTSIKYELAATGELITLNHAVLKKGGRSIEEFQFPEVEKIDNESFSRSVILSMITNPEDENATNCFLERDNKTNFILHKIDVERAFFPAFNNEGKKLIVKSVLFCMDLMKKPIPKIIIDEILNIDIQNCLKNWLQLSAQENDYLEACFGNDCIEKLYNSPSEFSSLIPIIFSQECIERILDTLYKVKMIFAEKKLANEEITPFFLFNYLQPKLEKIYADTFVQFPAQVKLNFSTVLCRYKIITNNDISLTCRQNVLSTQLSSKSKIFSNLHYLRLQSGLAYSKKTLTDTKKKSNSELSLQTAKIISLSPIEALQELDFLINLSNQFRNSTQNFQNINLNAMLPSQQVNFFHWSMKNIEKLKHYQEWTETLQYTLVNITTKNEFYKLYLREFDIKLENNDLIKILQNSGNTLTELELSHCNLITKINSGKLKSLRSLKVDNCKRLCSIEISEADSLNIFFAQLCESLDVIEIPLKNLKSLDLRDCDRLPQKTTERFFNYFNNLSIDNFNVNNHENAIRYFEQAEKLINKTLSPPSKKLADYYIKVAQSYLFTGKFFPSKQCLEKGFIINNDDVDPDCFKSVIIICQKLDDIAEKQNKNNNHQTNDFKDFLNFVHAFIELKYHAIEKKYTENEIIRSCKKHFNIELKTTPFPKEKVTNEAHEQLQQIQSELSLLLPVKMYKNIIYYYLANINCALQMHEEALDNLEKINNNKNSESVYNLKAKIFFLLRNTDKPDETLKRLSVMPSTYIINYYRAILYQELSRHKDAVEKLEEADKQNGNNEEINILLYKLQWQIDKKYDAVNTLMKLIEIENNKNNNNNKITEYWTVAISYCYELPNNHKTLTLLEYFLKFKKDTKSLLFTINLIKTLKIDIYSNIFLENEFNNFFSQNINETNYKQAKTEWEKLKNEFSVRKIVDRSERHFNEELKLTDFSENLGIEEKNELKTLKAILTSYPSVNEDFAEVNIYLAKINCALGNYNDAIACLDRIDANNNTTFSTALTVKILRARIHLLFKESTYKDESILEIVMGFDSPFLKIRNKCIYPYYCAVLYDRIYDHSKNDKEIISNIISNLTRCINTNELPILYYKRAIAYHKLNKLHLAISDLETAKKLDLNKNEIKEEIYILLHRLQWAAEMKSDAINTLEDLYSDYAINGSGSIKNCCETGIQYSQALNNNSQTLIWLERFLSINNDDPEKALLKIRLKKNINNNSYSENDFESEIEHVSRVNAKLLDENFIDLKYEYLKIKLKKNQTIVKNENVFLEGFELTATEISVAERYQLLQLEKRLEQCSSLKKYSNEIFLYLAKIKWILGEHDEALSFLNKLVNADDVFMLSVFKFKLRICLLKKYNDCCMVIFDRLHSEVSQDCLLRYYRGLHYTQIACYTQAIVDLDWCIEEKGLPIFYYQRAATCEEWISETFNKGSPSEKFNIIGKLPLAISYLKTAKEKGFSQEKLTCLLDKLQSPNLIKEIIKLMYEVKDYHNVIRYFTKHLDTHNSFDVFYYVGISYLHLKKIHNAINYLSLCLKKNDHPMKFEIWINLGRAYKFYNAPVESKKCFLNAYNIKPDNILCNFELAIIYLNEDSHETAKEHLLKTTSDNTIFNNKFDFIDIDSALKVIDLYKKINAYHWAISILETIIQSCSNKAELFFDLGLCYQQIKCLDKAVENFWKAITIDNSYSKRMKSLIGCANELSLQFTDYSKKIDDRNEKIRRLTLAIELHDKNNEAYFLRAIVKIEIGDETCLVDFKQALKGSSVDNAEYRKRNNKLRELIYQKRSDFHLKRKNYLGAETDLEYLLPLATANDEEMITDILLKLGKCKIHLKKYDQAKQIYRKIFKNTPLHPEASYKRALIALKTTTKMSYNRIDSYITTAIKGNYPSSRCLFLRVVVLYKKSLFSKALIEVKNIKKLLDSASVNEVIAVLTLEISVALKLTIDFSEKDELLNSYARSLIQTILNLEQNLQKTFIQNLPSIINNLKEFNVIPPESLILSILELLTSHPRLMLGLINLENAKYSQAIDNFESALPEGNGELYHYALLNIAYCHLKENHFENTVKIYKEIFTLYNKENRDQFNAFSSPRLKLLELTFSERGITKYQNATQAINETLDLSAQKKVLCSAINGLTAVINISSNNIDAFFNRSIAKIYLSSYDCKSYNLSDAVNDLKTVLILDPNHQHASKMLVSLTHANDRVSSNYIKNIDSVYIRRYRFFSSPDLILNRFAKHNPNNDLEYQGNNNNLKLSK